MSSSIELHDLQIDDILGPTTSNSKLKPRLDVSTEDKQKLKRVPQHLPLSSPCWLIAAVELCERFSYYGLSGPFMNYMQYSPHDTRIKGALNLGHGKAAALSYFFQFWCYICPVLGAWVADSYWGKYKTIKNFSYVYIVGIFILFVSSLPAVVEKGYSMGGFLLAIVIIGLGTGGVKANVSPLIADCVPKFEPYVKQQQSSHTSSKVIVDPKLTMSSVFMVFYLCINIGSLSSIITTTLESKVDFWAAYLLAFGFFCIGIVVFISGEKHYTHVPPSKSAISQCFKITAMAIRNGFNFGICKHYMTLAGEQRDRNIDGHIGMPHSNFEWDNSFVEDVASALRACKAFLFFIPYWAVYGQMLNNFISQAGQMELHGIPNDILQNIDPITIIIFIPICDKFVYPLIRRCGVQFTAFHKITWGFMFGSMAMAYAGFVQYLIYTAGPCYNHPLTCNPENQHNNNSGNNGSGQLPNQVHVAIQAPAYFFMAISEILASVTGLEYAYNCAPDTMKSFIMSLFLLTSAAGSLLGMIVAPLARDPFMVWFYGGLGVCCFVSGVAFWYFCKGIGNDATVMGATGTKEEAFEHDETEVALLEGRRDNSDTW